QIAPNPKDVQIYLSVPGIGKKTALRIYAELGDLRRFNNANQVDAFIGIDPGESQSGNTDKHLPITKHGNAIA
ncbi:transposase, partial [Lactobacillus helveticus]